MSRVDGIRVAVSLVFKVCNVVEYKLIDRISELEVDWIKGYKKFADFKL